jgi:hypothetical protein
MNDRFSHEEMAHQLSLMVSAKVDWLRRFSDGKAKRPDHEIDHKRRELAVLNQAAGDYKAAASRSAA